MFSLPKLLVLLLIIVAVLYGFKLFSGTKRRNVANERDDPPAAKRQERESLEAEDLVQCPDCGAYIAPGGAHDCRREA